MGVDYYPCDGCGGSWCDCGDFVICSNCETTYCDDCMDDQIEKYGTCGEDHERADEWGEDALVECERCSIKSDVVTKDQMIEFLLCESASSKREIKERILKYRRYEGGDKNGH
jgi:hypothetical protein